MVLHGRLSEEDPAQNYKRLQSDFLAVAPVGDHAANSTTISREAEGVSDFRQFQRCDYLSLTH